MLRPISIVFASLLFFCGPLRAETRVFVIANQADTYGVDRCLASSHRCGFVVATAYCQAQQFSQAISYRKLADDEITSAVEQASTARCRGGVCPDLVAIECSR